MHLYTTVAFVRGYLSVAIIIYFLQDNDDKTQAYINPFEIEGPRYRKFFQSENPWFFTTPHRYYKRSFSPSIVNSWDSNGVPLPTDYLEARQTRARGNYKNTVSFGRQAGGHHTIDGDDAKPFRRFSKKSIRGYLGMRG